MKNIEKYYDEIRKIMDNDGISIDCAVYQFNNKVRNCAFIICSECRLKGFAWLNSEYVEPIKLTHAEKVILENMKKATRIKRAERGTLLAGSYQGSWWDFSDFGHLFQFVKDEPLEIKRILENCEVIEDGK